MKEKIEKWLTKLPEEANIVVFDIEPLHETVQLMAEKTPRILKCGYEINIKILVNEWEES